VSKGAFAFCSSEMFLRSVIVCTAKLGRNTQINFARLSKALHRSFQFLMEGGSMDFFVVRIEPDKEISNWFEEVSN